MRVASLILGIVGGIAGLGGALFALFVGAVDAAFSETGTSPVVVQGIFSILFSLLGIVGGAFSLNKPKISGILMIVASLGGLVSISWGYVVAFPSLLIGGILAIISSKNNEKQTVDVN
ncbi:DUF4064 domain-containing protein [Brockia lithotrophica]|uniref:DUF4064 domain-containing protein n=1 Tax=Brockia lithotrophica TaxID=933949 RepID=UPI000EB07D6E|nr:DUF4064 domain-containing protein [Brockia lithotrophica]